MRLDLPVFHVGYFKHTLQVIQSVCKECARILLSNTDRLKYLKLIRAHMVRGSEKLVSDRIIKQVQETCKKTRVCFDCGAYNGIVKKMIGSPLQIVHDKLNMKDTTVRGLDDDYFDLEAAHYDTIF